MVGVAVLWGRSMDSHPSGLRFLPPPFHHPGWRSHPHPHHPHHECLTPKISSACFYASRRKEQGPPGLEFEAGKFPPTLQPDVSPLPGLEMKEATFSARQGGPRQPNFASDALQPPSLTIFPPPRPPCEELTSAAPKGSLLGGSPATPSDFAENRRNYEVSILLKPNYGSAGSKGRREEEEEEDEEEEEEEKNLFPKTPSSLDLSQHDTTSQGG